jgi:hypothetical protein
LTQGWVPVSLDPGCGQLYCITPFGCFSRRFAKAFFERPLSFPEPAGQVAPDLQPAGMPLERVRHVVQAAEHLTKLVGLTGLRTSGQQGLTLAAASKDCKIPTRFSGRGRDMGILRRWVVVASALVSLTAQAQSPVDSLIVKLLPTAVKARESVVNHPTMDAYEIALTIREAVSTAMKSASESPEDLSEALRSLTPLEAKLGPVREIPSIELHFILAALAQQEKRAEDNRYHLAYGTALFVALNLTGNGSSPATAYKVVTVAEEYDWFKFRQRFWKPKTRVSTEIEGKFYDVWTAVSPSGEERQIYFDASALSASLLRVASARRAKEAAAPSTSAEHTVPAGGAPFEPQR